ncbi:MFS transporter [Leifsonia sp. SIMBA_070]|uniref:MFS transporter n=1 Tax=Leifsonia sp. SIMBA_070 TaxID=3085810 RepID=UPI003978BD1D
MSWRSVFRILWISQALSQFGTSVSSLAYPLLLLDTTGSAMQAGLVGTVVAATGLLTRLPAGAVSDRRPARGLLLAADGARAALLASLSVCVASGVAATTLVLVVVALEVVAGSVFAPAEFRLIRAITPQDERALAVGRMQSRAQLAGLLGPLAGGALYGVAPWLPFAVDAASYLVSLVLLLAVPPAHGRSVAGRAAGGAWRWLVRERFLFASALWVAALTATFGAVGLIVIVLAQERSATSTEIGLMYTISGFGGLVGALLTPAIQRRLRPAVVFRSAASVDTLAVVALLPLHSPVLIGVCGAVAFFTAPVVSASLFGELSRRVPDELVGRVQASVALLVGALAPIAPAAVGVVVDRLGATAGTVGCAVSFGFLTVVSFVLPAFRAPAAAAQPPRMGGDRA